MQNETRVLNKKADTDFNLMVCVVSVGASDGGVEG